MDGSSSSTRICSSFVSDERAPCSLATFLGCTRETVLTTKAPTEAGCEFEMSFLFLVGGAATSGFDAFWTREEVAALSRVAAATFEVMDAVVGAGIASVT